MMNSSSAISPYWQGTNNKTYDLTEAAWKLIKDHNPRHRHGATEMLEGFYHTYNARRRGKVEEFPEEVQLGDAKVPAKQLQDGSGLDVRAGEFKRRDSRADAPLFISDPTPAPTLQKDAFEYEVTQAEPNVDALQLNDTPLNGGEITPEFLKGSIGYGFPLDEAHACLAKMAKYTSNPSALNDKVKTANGRRFKADVLRALKTQFLIRMFGD